MLKNTKTLYGSVSQFFHWLVALLIIGMLIFGYLMTGHSQVNIHKWIGLFILTLATCRLIWTVSNIRPNLPGNNPKWDTISARVTQVLLYVCMFGMPLSGWAMATAFGKPPHLYGDSFPMPGIYMNEDIGSFYASIHNTTAIILASLVSLHVLGAFKHFIIDKDNVLESMLPAFASNILHKLFGRA